MIIHPPVTVTTLHLSVLSYDLFLLLVFSLFLVLIFEAELNLQNTPQAAIGPFFSQPFLSSSFFIVMAPHQNFCYDVPHFKIKHSKLWILKNVHLEIQKGKSRCGLKNVSHYQRMTFCVSRLRFPPTNST